MNLIDPDDKNTLRQTRAPYESNWRFGTIHRAIRPKENPAKAIWANALWRGSRPLYCRQSLGRQGNASRQPRVPLIYAVWHGIREVWARE
jgi:hypothetical protein